MNDVMDNIDAENEHLKIISSIIEFRCNNILKTHKLLKEDLDALYLAKSRRSQDKICEDIYIKLEYIEILLSKCIDDVMTVEIMEMDNNVPCDPAVCTCSQKDDGNNSYQ